MFIIHICLLYIQYSVFSCAVFVYLFCFSGSDIVIYIMIYFGADILDICKLCATCIVIYVFYFFIYTVIGKCHVCIEKCNV